MTNIDNHQDFFWKVLYENSTFVPSTLAAKAKSLKISYLVSAGDVYRTFITTAEVCGQKMWDFRFKVRPQPCWSPLTD